MWIYPIVGVRGIKCDHLLVTPEGIVNDRIWMIVDKKELTPVGADNSVLITFLRCVINKENRQEMKVCLQDSLCLPEIKKRSVMLKFNEDYSSSEMILAT